MKHDRTLHFGQDVHLYVMSKGLIKRINDRMDKDIKEGKIIDARESLSAKIQHEYRILHWLPEMDTDEEIPEAVKHAYGEANVDKSFLLRDIQINDAWINDQREHEYQVLHKHSGNVQVGFASVMFLKVPDDWGEEFTETSAPHNGRLSLAGNCGGLFSVKQYLVTPQVGDFYIFPYDLEHCVYPFRGSGIRRSLSINFDLNMIKGPPVKYK
tara:strand:+ start:9735 stop:10370 length:636 start_codon:yes stop_codon:yes gene_type:complete